MGEVDIGLCCHECQFSERYSNPDVRLFSKAFCRLGKMQVDEYGKCVIPDDYIESIYPKKMNEPQGDSEGKED